MRLLTSLSLAMAAGAAGMFLMPSIEEPSDLAVVTSVTSGGMARVAAPSEATRAVAIGADAKPVAVAVAGNAASVIDVSGSWAGFGSTGSGAMGAGDAGRWAGRRLEAVAPPQPVTVARFPTRAEERSTSAGHERMSDFALARALQLELKRVGCYSGTVDGDWGPGSRRGMQAFVSELNSGLPSDRPDFILLTLVKGYTGTACQQGSGGGTVAAEQQRQSPMLAAVPQPVPVYRLKPARPAGGEVAAVGPVTPAVADRLEIRRLPEGRMSVGGPVSDLRVPAPVAAERPLRRPQVVQRIEPPRRTSQQRRRRDSSWTGKFFDSN